MPAVSNTSPVLNLAIIERLDLLRTQFGQVLIPHAVCDELRLNEPLPGTEAMRAAMSGGWLMAVDVENSLLVDALALDLDRGEAEAIALAMERETKTVLMDEREGRESARRLGLSPVGALGVLLKAKADRHVESLRREMNRLRDEAGFFVAHELRTALLEAADE